MPKIIENLKYVWEGEYKEQDGESIQTAAENPPDILERFLRKPTIQGDQFEQFIYGQRTDYGDLDLFNWWERSPYQHLRQLAFDSLSVPAMSSDVERIFSSAKKLLSRQRNRIDEGTVECVELLRDWWRKEVVIQ